MTWPPWNSSLIKRGFQKGSLLEGKEPWVWEALGRLPRDLFATKHPKKQLVIRRALEEFNLGWIATNTTPFRVAIGGLYDAAAKVRDDDDETHENDPPATKRQKTDDTKSPWFRLQSNALPPCSDLPTGILEMEAEEIKSEHRQTVWQRLNQDGAVLLRQAVAVDKVQSSLENSSNAVRGKPIPLRPTMGNGVTGDPPSIYGDLSSSKFQWLSDVENKLWNLLLGEGSPEGASSRDKTFPRRKSILLQYGDGAENWAHQDNNREEIPIQAVLLLSDPSTFSGGEFYVARQESAKDDGVEIRRNIVTFESAGDLILFMASVEWWHGMMSVSKLESSTESSPEGYVREAVGMLQPK